MTMHRLLATVAAACSILALGPRAAPGDATPVASRTFELTCRATVRDIPEGASILDVWLPLPQTDANQTVDRVTIKPTGLVTIGREARHGNQSLHVRVDRPTKPVAIDLT